MKVDKDFFQYCCNHNHSIAVKSVSTGFGIDPSAHNNWTIPCASSNGHLAVVERLLQDPHVDSSADNNYALRWASSKGHLAVGEIITRFSNGSFNNCVIRWASEYGHLSVVEKLLLDSCVYLKKN